MVSDLTNEQAHTIAQMVRKNHRRKDIGPGPISAIHVDYVMADKGWWVGVQDDSGLARAIREEAIKVVHG